MKKYFYFAIVFLVMFSCENEDLDEISSKANNTANIAPLSSLYVRMGEVSALAEKLNCEVIPADATSVEDLENVRCV